MLSTDDYTYMFTGQIRIECFYVCMRRITLQLRSTNVIYLIRHKIKLNKRNVVLRSQSWR